MMIDWASIAAWLPPFETTVYRTLLARIGELSAPLVAELLKYSVGVTMVNDTLGAFKE
jgi:hypothetical protein